MKRADATIHAGVCGFTTEVAATCEDGQRVDLAITSDCQTIKQLAEHLPPLDAFAEIGDGFDGQLLSTVRGCIRGCCAGCAVPAGLFKAMQVAAGLALPSPVAMEFRK